MRSLQGMGVAVSRGRRSNGSGWELPLLVQTARDDFSRSLCWQGH